MLRGHYPPQPCPGASHQCLNFTGTCSYHRTMGGGSSFFATFLPYPPQAGGECARLEQWRTAPLALVEHH